MSGNKIGNLQLLSEAGFNVPRFTRIPFGAVVNKSEYRRLLGEKEDVSAGDHREILEASLRKDFDVRNFLDFAKDIPLFSVRSSCSVEDGEELSFPGSLIPF